MSIRTNKSTIRGAARPAVLGLSVLAGMISQAYAQESAEPPTQVVLVEGYRNSLQTSAREKRKSTGFQDAVFAEDIGKFPDANIADSLARIPGIQVSREITGEGLSIQIRGLGSSFTKVLLNGAPVAIASSGRTDASNNNREVDLDVLPTDLFTKLTVSKSPSASLIEGGAAGVVDMRSARPFDNPGKYVALSLDGKYNSAAGKPGNKGSIIASQTVDNTFGILGGLSWSRAKINTTGFESVGWTNPNLSASQNTSATRNSTGGGNWTIPATVPANAGNGLVAGTVIDQAFLLAHNPGLNITQIDNAIIPRLGRYMGEAGTKDKVTGIVSAEFRPNKDLHFYLDTMYSKKDNEMDRAAMSWVGRNGAIIPLNMTVDRSDCSHGCVVTGATYANAQNVLEWRNYQEKASVWSVNPGMEWKLSDKLAWNAQFNLTKSKFSRSAPTVMPSTAVGNGNTVTYLNGGGIPSITSSLDLNNPASFVWSGGRVNVEPESRAVTTKGVRSDLTWGDPSFNVKIGAAYDDFARRIEYFNNTAAWQAAVCGNNPTPYLPAPNNQPPCNGANAPGSAAALYPGYGTGYTAGSTTMPAFAGSLIPTPALPSYLMPGPNGLLSVDWNRFSADTNFDRYNGAAPQVSPSGYISEKTTGFYTELGGKSALLGVPVRYNAGVRYVNTRQRVGAFGGSPDPRNGALTLSGSRYPDVNGWRYQDSTYHNTLPSASAAFDLRKDLIVRTSASRTMTRANPDTLRPGIIFNAPSADLGSIGNAKLAPYLSDNLDLGVEWYTGREGYVSATVFHKKIGGFTLTENVTMPFSALAQYGVTYETLSATQQAALNTRGGPAVATVDIAQSRNAAGRLTIDGLELGWVQPLDKWLPIRGFGINENVTFTHQRGSGEGTSAIAALGVPKRSNNLTVYYENGGYMARFSHSYSDGFQATGTNQVGITEAAIFNAAYKQLDFSASFDLDAIFDKTGWPTITADVSNLGNGVQRQYFQFTNATLSQYKPGRTFGLGLRMKF
jgi:TonB-dependent receptor